ncbi:MAG: hypothetical protein AAGE92_16145 [Cyanobacteria bacterium P01_G01_bin.4]
MFPIHSPSVFFLVLSGVALLSALAFSFGWKARIPFLILVYALLNWFWSTLPTSGDHIGLKYVFFFLPAAAAFFAGAVWGVVMKNELFWVSVLIPVIVAGVYAGNILWRQYIPEACLGESLKVHVAKEALSLPPEMQPSFEDDGTYHFFGRMERKTSYAQLCRMSRNGTRAIDMDVVRITPAANYSRVTTTCDADNAPEWCRDYSAFPYRHMGEVLISPRPGLPEYYWDGSIENERFGNLTEGSICLLPEDGRKTQCWVWQPFGEGLRLTVSTNNLDEIFNAMPVQRARAMTIDALETTLSIISNPG